MSPFALQWSYRNPAAAGTFTSPLHLMCLAEKASNNSDPFLYSVSENLLTRKLIKVQVVKWRLSSLQQQAALNQQKSVAALVSWQSEYLGTYVSTAAAGCSCFGRSLADETGAGSDPSVRYSPPSKKIQKRRLVLPPSQIIRCFTFFTPSLITRLIQKNLCKHCQI